MEKQRACHDLDYRFARVSTAAKHLNELRTCLIFHD